MERVIVTVKREGEARVRDLELPAGVPSAQIAEEVAQALGWHLDTKGWTIVYSLEAHPPGRLLRPDETLAQAQAWDGTWLVLKPQTTLPPRPATVPTTSNQAPPAALSAAPQPVAPGPMHAPPAAPPPAPQGAVPASAPPDPTPAGPVKGWKPLDLSGAGQPAPPPADPPPSSSGFTWKRVDED